MKFRISLITLPTLLLIAQAAAAQMRVSEEVGPIVCGPGSKVTSIRCDGSFCDDITITCGTWAPANTVSSLWTVWVEDRAKTAECARTGQAGTTLQPRIGVMSGIACRGSYCDDISLQCSAFQAWVADLTDCMAPISVTDGDGTINWPADHGVVSITCSGQHCDDKLLRLCRLVPRP